MAQSINDLYYPEVSPGKFLARSWRWSRHGYLIDAKTKKRLFQLAWWIIVPLIVAIILPIGSALLSKPIHPGRIYFVIPAIAIILVPYSILYFRLIGRGERVDLTSIDPTLRKLSSILVTWPKWLLALLVIPLGLFVGYGLTSIVFEPWSFSHTFAIFEMAVVYWLMLFALFSKREATR